MQPLHVCDALPLHTLGPSCHLVHHLLAPCRAVLAKQHSRSCPPPHDHHNTHQAIARTPSAPSPVGACHVLVSLASEHEVRIVLLQSVLPASPRKTAPAPPPPLTCRCAPRPYQSCCAAPATSPSAAPAQGPPQPTGPAAARTAAAAAGAAAAAVRCCCRQGTRPAATSRPHGARWAQCLQKGKGCKAAQKQQQQQDCYKRCESDSSSTCRCLAATSRKPDEKAVTMERWLHMA